ncbi:MAG: alpha/beta hydrolase [Brevinematales bacterium]
MDYLIDPEQIHFFSRGIKCAARLYRPAEQHPNNAYCIVMGHGFGLTMDCGLDPFISKFIKVGFFVMTFDYRHFGHSEGKPRQVLIPGKQIEDWSAAVEFASHSIDNQKKKIILWGTSFSGGYVISAGVKNPDVTAIIAQCPALDGLSIMFNTLQYAGIFNFIRLSCHSILDWLCALFNLKPHTIRIYGNPGEIAAMATVDSKSGYESIVSRSETFINNFCARTMLLMGMHLPVLKAKHIKCPVLLLICKKDSVAPVKSAKLVRKKSPEFVQYKEFDIGHFDIYLGKNSEISIKEQLSFLNNITQNNL